MKKRVLALILACTITLTNGNIAFAAEKDSENTTDTMVMEEEETTQTKSEEDTEAETPEDVTESDTTENETADATNTDMKDKPEENVNTTSVNTNSIAVETSEDVLAQGAATSGNYGVNMGNNIIWNFDEVTSTLTLSGSGEMYNLSPGEGAEWHAYYNKVKKIVINEGISSIGTNAFCGLEKAESIKIPHSVKTIYSGALQGCESIEEVHLPNNLTNIGTNAFFLMGSCKGFYIDEPGPKTAYHTEDGVLFCNQTLITYPQGNTRASYRVPYGTEKLEGLAFANTTYLQTVYIPETMTKLDSKMFSDESNGSTHMQYPLQIYFCTTEVVDQFGMSEFKNLPKDSRIYAKRQETCTKINNGGVTNPNDVRAEVYQQTEPYSAYEALKKTYANHSYRINSGRTTLFRYESADAPTATDTTTWTSSNTEIAVSKNGMGYITGGTKPGTATITVTREDKKDSFSFTVANVVPTTSTELYHQADGKQQVLGNSLCIHTGKSDTVSLKTVPELTTALAEKVTWISSDSSKVSVKASGTHNEKATLSRKAAGDVTVTAAMKDENGKEIKKTFQVIGDKSTEYWYAIVDDDDRVWVTDSAPVEPKVEVRDSNSNAVLREGIDYTLSYRDNFLPQGENDWWGYVTIYPIGAYNGNPSIENAFVICRSEQSDDDDSKNPDNQKKDDNQNTSDSKKTQNSSTTNNLKKQKITKVSSAYKKSVGQSFTLKPKAKGKITYKTGNKKVATVNSKGKVTVKGTGKATITVTAKATSTYSKCVKKITVYGVPKKPEMKKLTAGKKKFTVQWKKDKKADGYQVQYSTDKKFKKNIKSVNVSKKSTKATVKKLKKGKTYRVRTRSYKKIDGKKYYSGWSKMKSVKVK
ncbi:MAG: leucine-rich repeat protein [Lachnospiraceae bacterium]|nr:leucine-rich repeat protein [Lachnospiraceae bacterium]